MTTAKAIHGEPWTASDAAFGARLALIRQRMGWGNVKEAALACGMPVESWRSWERDNVLPRRYLETCAQIAAAAGCDYGWLVDRRPSGSSQPTAAYIRAKLRAIEGNGRTTTRQSPLLTSL